MSDRAPLRRVSVLGALEAGDFDALSAAYLHLARALAYDNQLDRAITELETAFDLLSSPAGRLRRTPWEGRVLLALTGLYESKGLHVRARATARLARTAAAAAAVR